MTGTCECGNEPLGSIKCGEFLVGLEGRIILRWIFRKWDVEGMDWIDLAENMDR